MLVRYSAEAPRPMTRSTTPFVLGACAGLLVAIAANLLPYWLSYGADATDGYEVIGFPFTFRRIGGYAGVRELHVSVLIADVVIAIGFAACAGWATVNVLQSYRRSGR